MGLVIAEVQPYLITTYFNSLGEVVMVAKNRESALEAAKVIALYGLVPYGIGAALFKKRNLLY